MAYLAPVTTTPVLIMWAALYRGLRLTESYVTDSTRLQQGYAAALTGADEYLNLIDLRLNSLGAVQ